MNLLVVFAGGLCLITGIYGLVEQGYAPIYTGAVVWGSLIIGFQIGANS
jgi:hypothetical protein